jgi:hypothetical protein
VGATTFLAHLALLTDLMPLGDAFLLDLSIVPGREVEDTQFSRFEGDLLTHIQLR